MKRILSFFLVVIVSFSMLSAIKPAVAIGGVQFNQYNNDKQTDAFGRENGAVKKVLNIWEGICPEQLYDFLKTAQIPEVIKHPLRAVNNLGTLVSEKTCTEWVTGKYEEAQMFVNRCLKFYDDSVKDAVPKWPFFVMASLAGLGALVLLLNVLSCLV